MHGLYVTRFDQHPSFRSPDDSRLHLLLSGAGYELMRQDVRAGAAMWVEPAADPATVEFFYVLSGTLRLCPDGEPPRLLRPGDSFRACGLKSAVLMNAPEDASLLYLSDAAVFSDLVNFNDELNELLARIDETDHYTRRHSGNVMRYAIALMKRFIDRIDLSREDMIIAALFHDVGKCQISPEILGKRGRLTREEYDAVKRHAAYSAEILRPRYSDDVANIVLAHHERLDGSGYPHGLRGDAIPFGARLIAVADSFDAMTTARPYNTVKKDVEACAELVEMSAQYDREITLALRELVASGEIYAEFGVSGGGKEENP